MHLTLLPYQGGGRAEDQADAALGEGIALDRHRARYPGLPLRRADPGKGTREAGAVLQRAARRGDRGAMTCPRSTRRRWPITARGWTRRCSTRSDQPRAGARSGQMGGRGRPHQQPRRRSAVAIVGKYTQLEDAYKSIAEALTHGGMANRVKVKAEWIDAEIFEARTRRRIWKASRDPRARRLRRAWHRGQDQGRPNSRATRQVPYLGICLGMQMAVIEAARNLAGPGRCGVRGVRPRGRGENASRRWSIT
jgi:hypothetical protein